MLTNTFSIDLGLPHVEILDVQTYQQGHYHIEIRSTETEGYCHICDELTSHFHGYDRKITLQHLSILGKECHHLHLQLPRFSCEACPRKPTTTLQPVWRRRSTFDNCTLKRSER